MRARTQETNTYDYSTKQRISLHKGSNRRCQRGPRSQPVATRPPDRDRIVRRFYPVCSQRGLIDGIYRSQNVDSRLMIVYYLNTYSFEEICHATSGC